MITQLLISSSAKPIPIITASYLIVGGGGGATVNGADGLGGDVINGIFTLLSGTYSVVIGSGGIRSGGQVGSVGTLGSSSSFYGVTANGSTRTTTVSVNGQIFSGVDLGSGYSNIAGSGASASNIPTQADNYCYAYAGSPPSSASRCGQKGGSWTNLIGGNGNNGVVILTVPTANASLISTNGATITTNGSNTIYTYQSSGSIAIT